MNIFFLLEFLSTLKTSSLWAFLFSDHLHASSCHRVAISRSHRVRLLSFIYHLQSKSTLFPIITASILSKSQSLISIKTTFILPKSTPTCPNVYQEIETLWLDYFTQFNPQNFINPIHLKLPPLFPNPFVFHLP